MADPAMATDDLADHSAPERPPSAVDLGGGAWVPRGSLRWSFTRSGGPGGQNVNKVSTRAELRVPVAEIQGLHPAAAQRLRAQARARITSAEEILIVADETRSQLDNRAACVARLRDLVGRAQVVPKRRRATKPTRGSKERRLEGKRRESEKKRRRRAPDE